jgi:GH15 family glucan-1,4-alpha-glucosidase
MPAPRRARWVEARDAVRRAIDEHGVDREGGHFVSAFGTRTVDASLLKLATCGLVDPRDPRMVATVRAIEERLVVNGFVRRSEEQHPDSTVAADDEGCFLLCSCWLVEVLALQGRRKDAEGLLDRVASVANDVGLFAEEYDPVRGELLGNFPQAFTHLGVVTAARRLREG